MKNFIGTMTGRFITRPEPASVEKYVRLLLAYPHNQIEFPVEFYREFVSYGHEHRPLVASDGKEYYIYFPGIGATGAGSPVRTTYPVCLHPWPPGPSGVTG